MQYPLPEKKTISVKATLIKCYLVDIIENSCQDIASKSKHFTENLLGVHFSGQIWV